MPYRPMVFASSRPKKIAASCWCERKAFCMSSSEFGRRSTGDRWRRNVQWAQWRLDGLQFEWRPQIEWTLWGASDVLPRFNKSVICVAASIRSGDEQLLRMTWSRSCVGVQQIPFGHTSWKDRAWPEAPEGLSPRERRGIYCRRMRVLKSSFYSAVSFVFCPHRAYSHRNVQRQGNKHNSVECGRTSDIGSTAWVWESIGEPKNFHIQYGGLQAKKALRILERW
jgi:hypothetical protein